MNTKHTPGPWLDESAGSDAMVRTCANADRAMMIDCTRSGNTPTEDKSNARLIAAAPDLLAALERMTDAYDSLLRAYEKPHGWGFLESQLARETIARAKGQA